jgi:hypothetical protein
VALTRIFWRPAQRMAMRRCEYSSTCKRPLSPSVISRVFLRQYTWICVTRKKSAPCRMQIEPLWLKELCDFLRLWQPGLETPTCIIWPARLLNLIVIVCVHAGTLLLPTTKPPWWRRSCGLGRALTWYATRSALAKPDSIALCPPPPCPGPMFASGVFAV